MIVLAIYAVDAAGGMTVMKSKLATHFGSETAALSVLPISFSGGGIVAYAWMPILTLAVFLGVQWWAAWYPGAEPGGGQEFAAGDMKFSRHVSHSLSGHRRPAPGDRRDTSR